MEIKCINDKNLEDVSGGFIYDEMGPIILKVKFSKEEFDELKKAKYIGEDGKFYQKDAINAFNYLEKKGYEKNMDYMVGNGIMTKTQNGRKLTIDVEII